MDTPSLFAGVDSCVLMHLAGHRQQAWRMIRAIRNHAGGRVTFVTSPTVIEELGCFAADYANSERQWLAATALNEIGGDAMPDFAPADFADELAAKVELAARRLRREGLLPLEEWHDTKLICEAAMLGCAYLLTDDTHLLGVPRQRLSAVLRQMDLPAPRIISYHAAL